MYLVSPSGMIKFMGVSIMLFTLLDKTIMVAMFIINYITLAKRFNYEDIPYTEGRRKLGQAHTKTSEENVPAIQIIHL